MRVLHAPVDIAGQPWELSKGLRLLGVESKCLVYQRHPFSYSCDISLDLDKIRLKPLRQLKYLANFIRTMTGYDIFHFHYGNSLLPYNLDIPLLKLTGKKVVMHFWGGDIEKLGPTGHSDPAGAERFYQLLKRRCGNLSAIVVGDYKLYQWLRGLHHNIVIIPQAVSVDDIPFCPPGLSNHLPLIVHAPSHRTWKGTEYVVAAIRRLKAEEYPFEFTLLENRPHHEAMEIYAKADIIVDQLISGCHGIFAVEGMALGKPVVCHVKEEQKDKYPPGLPLVNATPDTVYDILRLLLEQPSLRREIGYKGREYAGRVHDSQKVAAQLIELYQCL